MVVLSVLEATRMMDDGWMEEGVPWTKLGAAGRVSRLLADSLDYVIRHSI